MAGSLRMMAAAVAVAVLPMAAGAATLHTVRVLLPDGQVALMRYAGDVAPTLVLAPAPVAAMPAAFAGPLFAEMDATMAQQAALMRREMALTDAAFTNGGLPLLPASLAAGHACFEATSVVLRGGAPPQVTRVRSAGCGAPAPERAAPALFAPNGAPPAARHGAELIEASAR